MDLRRLRTFVTVAENGSVSKAAAVLRITQPALSRQIAGLEQDLGFALFERIGRRLILTPYGEQFLGDCRSLLAHAGTVSERATALRRGDIRVLRVAASALTIEGAFPTFLRRYAEHVPGVELTTVEEDDPAEHLNMLDRGQVDLSVNVINFVTVDERFAGYSLPPFQLLAACAPSLRSRADTVEIAQLAEHPLLLPKKKFATRAIFDAACRLARVKPRVVLESRAAQALLALAAAGHGVAIVPSILRPDRSLLAVMRVTHQQQPLQIDLAVLRDKRRTLPRYAESFADLLAAHIQEGFPSWSPAARKRGSTRSKGTR
jgi:DNA-binding transcriptional LysR family regulator